MSMDVKNSRAQNAAVIRNEILKLFFPLEPLVVLFHKEQQGQGERPEAYIEQKKLFFVAAGLA